MLGVNRDASEEDIKKAIEVNPHFAGPYFALAQVLDSRRKPADALAQYRAFLARTSRADPRRAEAEDRIRMLEAAPPPGGV